MPFEVLFCFIPVPFELHLYNFTIMLRLTITIQTVVLSSNYLNYITDGRYFNEKMVVSYWRDKKFTNALVKSIAVL